MKTVISYYKTIDNKISCIDQYEDGCWINCVAPDEEETEYLISKFHIEPDFLKSSLDEEESSHIDYENGVTLIILDSPVVERYGQHLTYYTVPLSIMVAKKCVITVSLKENSILEEFCEGLIRNVKTEFKTHFILQIILRMATKYLQYLKQIDKITNHAEKELRKSMKNKELVQFLEIEKSLVYFSSSLKANSITLEKITKRSQVRFYEDDQDLLEDVLVEIKQAVEMSDIYLHILSGTMEAYASIISNNLNIVMKRQASITLIISVPTVIAGIYGMNTPNLPFIDFWWFPIIMSFVLMFFTWEILKKTDML